MAIGLGSRRATEDVDGWFKPFAVVEREAAEMARERGLPDGWINQRAFAFMSFEIDDTDARSIEIGGLHVRIASPRFGVTLTDSRASVRLQAEEMIRLAR
ncbi:hypothetical protein ACEXQB_012370 [Herbiconiux sp. P18]|uniref:hypothetical protein n=1 Tax=Herbiconiux liangxiaofengii TaxID=3342795 RepID=UPI0035B9D138